MYSRKLSTRALVIGLLAVPVLSLPLLACDGDEGTVGEAIEEVKDEVEDAADEVRDEIDDAT